MALLGDVIKEIDDQGLQSRLERQRTQLQTASDRCSTSGGTSLG